MARAKSWAGGGGGKLNIQWAWPSKDTSLMRGKGLPWQSVQLKTDDCTHGPAQCQ